MTKKHPELAKSRLVAEIPLACADESAAVAFLERQRWGDAPTCAHCGESDVYQMRDSATGERNKRFLWRCRACNRQYSVRVGTVLSDSHLPLRHWCYGFWRAASSKKGVSALEIQRHCQIGYRAALFMLNRIRHAMAPALEEGPKLDGIVETDETYVGGKPRYKGTTKRGRGTSKTPVVACVQRGGGVRVRVVGSVSAASLKSVIREHTKPSATIVTDDLASYNGIGAEFHGGHFSVNHSSGEYSRPGEEGWPHASSVHTNSVEGFFSIVKRGLHGIYHSVSKHHLHRYMSEFAWRYTVRDLSDGERTCLLVKHTVGKRLLYREPISGVPGATAENA